MAEINIHQHNTNGTNKVSLSLDEALRPYDAELSVVMKTKFLDDASENLIRDGKLYRNDEYINKVKQYLDEKKFCLIKAPEGRGKTYLSRIIAYDYHTNSGMKVYFLDIKISNGITVNEIEDKLLEWHKDKNNNYLIIIENVHAYEYLEELMKRIKKWIDSEENHFWFLLNARPTDIELEEFSNWEEIVELKPDKKDVNGIIDLFAQEVQREPFANKEERDAFVEKIYSDNKKGSGANLRLQRIYLETWQYNPNIKFISGISENTVIKEFRKKYLKDGKKFRPKEEIEALWYISSLYQFDVPLHEDFVQNVGNLVGEGLLRFEGNRYHLPHSVDATFLYKAICDYKGKDYVDQMKTFATRFVKDILASDCPKDYESDFILLISGLIARKDDFKKVIYYLTSEDIAKEIITKIHYTFVKIFFRPENHDNPSPNTLINYYHDNKDWLIPLFLNKSRVTFYFVFKIFKNHLNYDIVRDMFENAKDLDDYLNNNKNYKILVRYQLLDTIAQLGAEHKTILIKNKDKYISLLKPMLLNFTLKRLALTYKVYMKHFNINIIEDVFKDAQDLDDYLKNKEGYKFKNINNDLLGAFMELGNEHKQVLDKYNVYHYFFYTKPIENGFRISDYIIFQFWIKKCIFDVSRIKNNRFYFNGVSWSYLERFVSIIKDSMTEENRQQSVNMVKTIIDMVLAKENALSYATAIDLSFFYYNIASVDETIFQKLTENLLVQTDIKRRLEASSYSVRDLYLFGLFWHDELVKKLGNRGEEITPGSLLDYIHHNPVLQSSFPEDRA